MKLTRRTFVAAGAGSALLAASGIGGTLVSAYKRRHRPNIILFVTDDMRFDAAGFSGNRIIKTPHLDWLASEGFVFDNNFVTTSVCPISRASIMSGDYALRHGVYDFDHHMNGESFLHSFPVLMQKSGYHTGFIGKWGMGGYQPSHNFNEWHGFIGQGTYYPSKNMHMTDLQTAQALQFLQHTPKDRPFLLIICYKAPHEPLIPQPRYANLYVNDEIPRAKTDKLALAAAIPSLIKMSKDRGDYFAKHFNNEKKYQESMKQYYRLITGVDDSVGTIIQRLMQDKRLDDTSILFTSDNGFLEGEHELEGKWCMYEESIRVPLLVRLAPSYFPYVNQARVSDISLNVDLSPTILDMASLEKPKHIAGKSLLPLVMQDTARGNKWREGFYYEHPGWDRQHVIACEGYRGVEWKYTRYRSGRALEECLFNVKDDPYEVNNLAHSPQSAAILRHMRDKTAL